MLPFLLLMTQPAPFAYDGGDLVDPGPTAAETTVQTWRGVNYFSSAVLGATGIGLMAYSLVQAERAAPEVCFGAGPGDCGGGGPKFLRFGGGKPGINMIERGEGPMVFPFGLAFFVAGGLAAGLTALFDDGLPWWQVAAGILVGGLLYGAFELADGGRSES